MSTSTFATAQGVSNTSVQQRELTVRTMSEHDGSEEGEGSEMSESDASEDEDDDENFE